MQSQKFNLYRSCPVIAGELDEKRQNYFGAMEKELKEWWYDSLIFIMESKIPPAPEYDHTASIPLKVYEYFKF